MKFALQESTCSIGLHDWEHVDRHQHWFKVPESTKVIHECRNCCAVVEMDWF